MRATGIVRQVDELGRVVIPVEIRRTYSIAIGDPLEIYLDGDRIMVTKYVPSCMFCDRPHARLIKFNEKLICLICIEEMASR